MMSGSQGPIAKRGKEVEESVHYRPGGFHPVHLQDKFKNDRYVVIHKLGHGGFATVWLARDSTRERYVTLKILAAKVSPDCPEVDILRRLKAGSESQGKAYVMILFDHFWIDGPNGRHLCVVSEVAGPSIKQFNDCPGQSNGSRRLRAPVARKVALQATEGLAYIHRSEIVHGDFTTANILLRIANFDKWSEDEIYERFGKPEIQELPETASTEPNHSAPRYIINGISMKEIDPKWLAAEIMIIDFGIGFLQKQSSVHIGTPKSYCAPEFLFHTPRTVYSDIWALGCTIYEIRTGSKLFTPKGKPTKSEMLKGMVKVLGPLPEKWWDDWEEGRDWYALQIQEDGELANKLKGTLQAQILDVGVHDGSHPPTSSSRRGVTRAGSKSSDESDRGSTGRLLGLVEDITTSEAEEVIARTHKTDPEQIEVNEDGSGSGSGNGSSSSKSKSNSASSNQKSGEKSNSSEHQEGSSSTIKESNRSDQEEDKNVIGDQTLYRRPLEPVKELPENLEALNFLEPVGTKVTTVEADGLENLLRRALTYLPEKRLGPSELAKHGWFVDDFND